MAAEAVKVIVRCRPVNAREERLNCEVGGGLLLCVVRLLGELVVCIVVSMVFS